MKMIKNAIVGLFLIIPLTSCAITASSNEDSDNNSVDGESTQGNSESSSSESQLLTIEKALEQLNKDFNCSNLSAYLDVKTPSYNGKFSCAFDDNKCIEQATLNGIAYGNYQTEIYGGIEYWVGLPQIRKDITFERGHYEVSENYSLTLISKKYLGLSLYDEINEAKDCLSISNGCLSFTGYVTLSDTLGSIIDLKIKSLSFEFKNEGRLSKIMFDGSDGEVNNYSGTIVIQSYDKNTIESELEKEYLLVDNIIYSKDRTELVRYPINSSETDFVIPNTVTTIAKNAFADCKKLKTIVVPDSVSSIGSGAFLGCTSLISINIPDGITEIVDYTFYSCSSLQSINIPDGVTSIGFWAFANCDSLKSVVIPASVSSIGSDAFRWCDSLLSVTFYGLCSMEYQSFDECHHLVEIILKFNLDDYADDPNYESFNQILELLRMNGNLLIQSNEDLLFEDNDGFVTYSDGTDTWLVAYHGSNSSIAIPSNITKLANNVFYECDVLKSIVIPNRFTKIVDDMFYGCSSLQSITIPDGVTSIGQYAFEGCSSLQSITIPNAVTSIGDSAFYGCSSLQSITIPNGVSIVGDYTFAHCKALASAVIPDSVFSIESSAFLDCTSLVVLSLGNSVNSIGFEAFSRCASLKTVKLPSSVGVIAKNAFELCTALSSINIPANVWSIGSGIFSRCSSLNVIDFDGTTSEWESVQELDSNWKDNCNAHTLHCTNGDIDL